ncbi:MAG: Com family DNA-binding transcriptional regulator [Curvibacter lanceolatus]|uniref:Com family DNA-binding transcriptional regulator n=1 Tax=Curvibacter lanceolatus TaxID=86182 RepID=UPI002357AA36|nr:Com family DNA-binding transcriptional regulator [Curvibacter lanceolatus]MBV5296279.1 Com family DNA-binding transcriptional regulator [Curvibacter lanceolatus]
MEEIRCGACSRKLGEGEYTRLVIKCPRCGAMNSLRAQSPTPERQGAPKPTGARFGTHHPLDRRQASPG